jgi:hypothetical protein
VSDSSGFVLMRVRAVRPASARNLSFDTRRQSLKLRRVRVERLVSSRKPLSDTWSQHLKLRLVRASNNFKKSYYHNNSTDHKQGETNKKLNTQ